MGMFSWLTADTQESISNTYSTRGAQTVYMLRPHEVPPLQEDNYEGYGVFGGMDAYVWLYQMNTDYKRWVPDGEPRRLEGVAMDFQEETNLRYPLKFSFDPKAVYEDLPASKHCPDQGFFYDDDFVDEDETCPHCGRSYY